MSCSAWLAVSVKLLLSVFKVLCGKTAHVMLCKPIWPLSNNWKYFHLPTRYPSVRQRLQKMKQSCSAIILYGSNLWQEKRQIKLAEFKLDDYGRDVVHKIIQFFLLWTYRIFSILCVWSHTYCSFFYELSGWKVISFKYQMWGDSVRKQRVWWLVTLYM